MVNARSCCVLELATRHCRQLRNLDVDVHNGLVRRHTGAAERALALIAANGARLAALSLSAYTPRDLLAAAECRNLRTIEWHEGEDRFTREYQSCAATPSADRSRLTSFSLSVFRALVKLARSCPLLEFLSLVSDEVDEEAARTVLSVLQSRTPAPKQTLLPCCFFRIRCR